MQNDTCFWNPIRDEPERDQRRERWFGLRHGLIAAGFLGLTGGLSLLIGAFRPAPGSG